MNTPIWAMGLFIIASVFSASATFFVKISAPKITRNIRRLIKNWQFFFGLFLYGLSVILSIIALKAGELSVLYPFIALQYVWANLLSRKFLDEKITVLKWVGVAMLFLGITLVGLGA